MKRFRLRPAPGMALPESVPCPRCRAVIGVPRATPRAEGAAKREFKPFQATPSRTQQIKIEPTIGGIKPASAETSTSTSGWVRTEISTIFDRSTAPRRPEDDLRPGRPALVKTAASAAASTAISAPAPQAAAAVTVESAPVEPEPARAPRDQQPKREFRDVTNLGRPSLLTEFEATSAAEPAPVQDSLRARLKKKLSTQQVPEWEAAEDDGALWDDAVSAVEGDFEEELRSIVEDASAVMTVSEPLSFGAEAAEPAEPAEAPAAESTPRVHFSPADREGPWELRVDQVCYDPVDEAALAVLLKSGVWLDVVELKTRAAGWVALSRHPVYPQVREHLLRQTQDIVAQVSTGEWQRDAAAGAVEVAADRAVAARPAPASPGSTASPAARPARHAWLSYAIALLAGVAAGLVVLAMALAVAGKKDAPDDAAAALAASRPPKLLTPALSEPADTHRQRALARAQTRVARARAPLAFARGLIARGRPAAARQVALQAMVDDRVRPALKEVFNQAIAADPQLHLPVLTLGVDETVDRIYALGGGRSISLRMTKDGANAYSFKPAQTEWGDGWRGELAAYHFCEIVPCHFISPRNRNARISRSDFESLYGLTKTEKQTNYAARFGDLHWVKEAGPDGIRREYLYGTLEDWAPHFVEWPIEYTQVYQDLLDVRFHPAELEMSYAEMLKPFKKLAGGRFYSVLLAEQGEASVRDIARQLSSLLVFDYLVQNWDRFSSTEKYYGVNNQFANGRFISIDNGAAFYDEPVRGVAPRFELTSRFSRSMVTAVRALDPQVVDKVLFPDPNRTELRRLRLFWQQRDKMLERVDALVNTYGAERVFEFR